MLETLTPEELQKTIKAEIKRHRFLFFQECVKYKMASFAIQANGIPPIFSTETYSFIPTKSYRERKEKVNKEKYNAAKTVWFKYKNVSKEYYKWRREKDLEFALAVAETQDFIDGCEKLPTNAVLTRDPEIGEIKMEKQSD